jgi:hypothetical protein
VCRPSISRSLLPVLPLHLSLSSACVAPPSLALFCVCCPSISPTPALVLTLALFAVRGRLPRQTAALVEPFGLARVRSVSEEVSHDGRRMARDQNR